MKTPLQLYIEVVTQKQVTINDGNQIRQIVKKLTTNTRNKREKRVGEYLLSCAEQRSMVGDHGFGSLNHVLKWLRDNAIQTYEISAKAAIAEAIKSDWPLENAIHFLVSTYMVQEYIPAMWKSDKKEDLKTQLAWVNQGPFRVAVNCGRKNLVGIAMQGGADIYIGASDEGAVVKTRTGLKIESDLLRGLGPSWAQPFPDMVLTKQPTDDPSEILDNINERVILAPERA